MNDKTKKSFLIVSSIIFAIAFCGITWFIKTRINFLLNSDDSSELILARLLSSENKLLSKNWYYSTELRVISAQIFYAFFFKIFDNWHKVRIASYICLYTTMIATYYFTCKKLKIQKYFFITAALLMIPFSNEYFMFTLKGAHYIFYISITFFTLGLCESYVAEMNKNRQKIYIAIGLLCSIFVGMGGVRQLTILYIPLVLVASIIMISELLVTNKKIICNLTLENKKYIIFSITSFIGSVIGYIINTKVLSKIYSFSNWNDFSFTGFDISKLSPIIDGFLSSYGYTPGKIFSSALLCNFLCACWLILTVGSCIYFLKNKKSVEPAHFRLALFTVMAFTIFIAICMFTNFPYVIRYNVPIIVLSVPMIAVLFKNIKLHSFYKDIIITIFVLLVACSGFIFCKARYKLDQTAVLRDIVTVLQNEKYTEGYSTFWNANVLTELSNGAINVWCWPPSSSDDHSIPVANIDDTFKWLQLVNHDYTHPKGKVFLLFTKDEWENNPWIGKLSTKHIIYQSDEYIVIGYENYDKLKSDTTQ